MKIVLLTVVSAVLLVGCSNKPIKNADNDKPDNTTPAPSSPVVYDTKKPTSFAEYKQWRRSNDPDSEAYAEFKAWEAKQREWKLKNDQ